MSKTVFDMYNTSMNKRDYKEFSCGSFTHIYNRGNNKENIFYDDQDYRAFLFRLGLVLGVKPEELQKEDDLMIPNSRIRIDSKENLFKLHSFCLMPNHFHLLIEQCSDTPISKLISQLCTSYAMFFNKKYNRVGHVFQDKFKSVLIEDDPQLMWTSSYIHMNPVKDGLTNSPEKYNWSSFKDFIQKRDLPILDKELLLSLLGSESFEKETLAYFSNKNEMSRTVLDTLF